MRVVYFGTYERHYPRNAQVISCLRKAGVDVVESHVSVWEGREHKFDARFRAGGELLLAELRLTAKKIPGFDVMIVGYPGHFDMVRARRVAGVRPLVFNPLVALEDTIVGDRALVDSSSFAARVARFVDHAAFRRANIVVADTRAHAQYFAARYRLADDRLAVCYVGAEDRLFAPGERRESRDVLFVGKLIPLHGIETILAAARQCPEISIRVVGSGQLAGLLSTPPDNVLWRPWVDYEALPSLYRGAGCALGIFGTSEKALRVIPNKAFQALATATPLITADTEAARELLEPDRNALLVPPGDVDALAAAMRRLVNDDQLRHEIGTRGRATYEEHASEDALGRRWRDLLEAALERRPEAQA
jgi:glycosyltransferase involved in cell wall biosynthesis